MKLLYQFGIIMFVTFLGDFLHWSDSVADPGKYLRFASDAGGSDDKSDQTGAGQDRSGLSDRDHAADVYPGRRWSDRDLE